MKLNLDVDSDFFKKLKAKEARLFLTNYLKEANKGLDSLYLELKKDNINLDYSLDSLPEVVDWFSKKMIKVEQKTDRSLPKWIIDSDSYKTNLFDFDDTSYVLIMRLSYYWGECFVRNTSLKWDFGKYASYKNQPILGKFIRNMEMSPFQICTTLMRSLITGESKDRTKTCIDSWLSMML